MQPAEKRARVYAAEILGIKTRQGRLDALNDVPVHLRPMVSDLVKSAFEIAKSRRRLQR